MSSAGDKKRGKGRGNKGRNRKGHGPTSGEQVNLVREESEQVKVANDQVNVVSIQPQSPWTRCSPKKEKQTETAEAEMSKDKETVAESSSSSNTNINNLSLQDAPAEAISLQDAPAEASTADSSNIQGSEEPQSSIKEEVHNGFADGDAGITEKTQQPLKNEETASKTNSSIEDSLPSCSTVSSSTDFVNHQVQPDSAQASCSTSGTAVSDLVSKSTLNPNAKEFKPFEFTTTETNPRAHVVPAVKYYLHLFFSYGEMHQGIPLPDMKNIARVLIRISNNQTVCELLVDFIVKSAYAKTYSNICQHAAQLVAYLSKLCTHPAVRIDPWIRHTFLQRLQVEHAYMKGKKEKKDIDMIEVFIYMDLLFESYVQITVEEYTRRVRMNVLARVVVEMVDLILYHPHMDTHIRVMNLTRALKLLGPSMDYSHPGHMQQIIMMLKAFNQTLDASLEAHQKILAMTNRIIRLQETEWRHNTALSTVEEETEAELENPLDDSPEESSPEASSPEESSPEESSPEELPEQSPEGFCEDVLDPELVSQYDWDLMELEDFYLRADGSVGFGYPEDEGCIESLAEVDPNWDSDIEEAYEDFLLMNSAQDTTEDPGEDPNPPQY